MKTVFASHSEVAHIWANLSPADIASGRAGRTSDGRVTFEGATLYSYGHHFALGVHFRGRVLLNADRYSISTSRHQSDAASAVRHLPSVRLPGLTELARSLDRLGRMGRVYNEAAAVEGSGVHPGYRDETPAEVRARDKATIRTYLKANAAPGDASLSPEAVAFLCGLVRLPVATFDRLREERATEARKAAASAAKYALEKALKNAADLLSASDADFLALLTTSASETRFYIKRGRYNWQSSERTPDTTIPNGELPRKIAIIAAAHKAAKAKLGPKKTAAIWARLKEARAYLAKLSGNAAIRDGNSGRKRLLSVIRDALAAHAAGRAKAWDYRNAGRQLREFAETLPTATPFGGGRYVRMIALADAAEAECIRLLPIEAAAEAEARRVREERQRIEREERAARDAQTKADWLAGVPGVRFRGEDEKGRAYIRAVKVERDSAGAIVAGDIETSQGAIVPLTHALRAFRFLKLCHDTGRTWRANGKSLSVGHYKVSEVRPDGFTAGCHRIAWEEVARVAAGLGIAETPADDSALETA